MQDFRKLRVWHKADQFAVDVIEALPPVRCRRVPGLRSQAIRAAGSVADLIAEGCGKESNLELARYCGMAAASAAEVRSQLHRARRTWIIDAATHVRLDAQADEIRGMLFALARTVRGQHGTDPDDDAHDAESRGRGDDIDDDLGDAHDDDDAEKRS